MKCAFELEAPAKAIWTALYKHFPIFQSILPLGIRFLDPLLRYIGFGSSESFLIKKTFKFNLDC